MSLPKFDFTQMASVPPIVTLSEAHYEEMKKLRDQFRESDTPDFAGFPDLNGDIPTTLNREDHLYKKIAAIIIENPNFGNKIQAIKVHRAATHSDLKTSKDYVEEVIKDLVILGQIRPF